MKVIETEDKISVWCDYYVKFIDRAKTLQGKWDGTKKCWTFPAENQRLVKELLFELYGEDGREQESVSVTLSFDKAKHPYEYDTDTIRLCGRIIASRRGRDKTVELADDVIVLEGGFERIGGSNAYPKVKPKEGTVLLIKRIPTGLYEKVKDLPEIELYEGDCVDPNKTSENKTLIAFNIPDEVLREAGQSEEEALQFVRRFTALGYFVRKGVSLGQAAQFAGMDTESFSEFLSGIAVDVAFRR